MDEIQSLGHPYATSEGWIQIALLYQQIGANEWAERALLDAASATEDHRPEEFGKPQSQYLEVQLQLARAWQQIGRYDRARRAYAVLVRDIDPNRSASAAERHIVAIAEYRLADLRVEEAPQEAYERWRRVVEMHDEEVSPYAALRMALQLGSVHLVGERVEKLFHYAMGTRDPRLFSESALGLARHLKDCNQFTESRRYLRKVLAADCAKDLTEQAGDELATMDRYEAMVRTRKPLRRPWQLQMKVQRGAFARLDDSVRRVIIVGAGSGGSYLRESLDPERYFVCGFVDDGVAEVPGAANDPILGRIEDLTGLLGDIKPDEVLLAIPTLSGARRRKVVLACREAETPLLNLPGMHELGIGWTRNENRRSLMTQLRPVRIEETLGEERRALDLLATGWLQFKTVVVIGAGAIGAELCRRLVDAEVRRLVVVDQRESALRKIETELCDFRDFEAIEVRLGNASESGFLTGVFESCSPYVVFNATGNGSPEAFEPRRLYIDPFGWKSLFVNEAGAARETVRAAGETGVPRVVHISSRRAGAVADPLGAMKALCEELFLHQATQYPETIYAAIRIGALLDSRNGRFATLENRIRTGAAVKAPPAEARAKFVPTWRWAEQILHAARLAGGGELFEPDSGVEFSPRQVTEEAVELANLFPDDVAIEEVPEHWDEPVCGALREREEGWAEFGMWRLDRPAAGTDQLQAAVSEFATLIDQRISAESGEGATLINAAVRRLREVPVGYGASEEPA
ncbi:MAG TPA: polysaccharide biosynthesis protein [Solirubrobacterales bacterium]|nr:polysaccharide biosynthesis protein [Solirubrobacterales bacterium]